MLYTEREKYREENCYISIFLQLYSEILMSKFDFKLELFTIWPTCLIITFCGFCWVGDLDEINVDGWFVVVEDFAWMLAAGAGRIFVGDFAVLLVGTMVTFDGCDVEDCSNLFKIIPLKKCTIDLLKKIYICSYTLYKYSCIYIFMFLPSFFACGSMHLKILVFLNFQILYSFLHSFVFFIF